MKTADWVSVSDALPDFDGDAGDFGDYTFSKDVLVTDGRDVWVGYCVIYYPEYAQSDPPSWRMKGPDSYTLKSITHWKPLPPLP